MTDKIRVLIAEDHTLVREGIRLIIDAQTDMEVVGEALDGTQAVALTQSLNPDVVLMDISMPGKTGFQATETISESCPEIKVLALTRHKEQAYLQQLIGAGADGYVLKQSPSRDLLQAIRTVAAGIQYLDPALAGTVLADYAASWPKVDSTTPRWVSKREEQVLRFIAWGYSNKEIAAKMGVSVKTVESHRSSAMRKMALRSRIDIVHLAVTRGWLEE